MDGAGVSFVVAGGGRLQNGLRYQDLDRGLQLLLQALDVLGVQPAGVHGGSEGNGERCR